MLQAVDVDGKFSAYFQFKRNYKVNLGNMTLDDIACGIEIADGEFIKQPKSEGHVDRNAVQRIKELTDQLIAKGTKNTKWGEILQVRLYHCYRR